MTPLVIAGITAQVLVLVIFVRRMGKECIRSIGFNLMAVTFAFHGLTEVVQRMFPEKNEYRESVGAPNVDAFVVVVSFGMLLFTICYFMTPPVRTGAGKLAAVIGGLRQSYLLRWSAMAAIGIPSFVLVSLRDQASAVDYWTGGLSDQFTPYLLMIGFITLCLRARGRYLILYAGAFIVLLVTSGSRTAVGTAIAVSICTLARCGIKLPARTIIGGTLVVALSFGALSTTRKLYGRFSSGEDFSERLEAIATSSQGSDTDISESAILDDTVYRFDGNTLGALILEKQNAGYPSTGASQLLSTFGYLIPSFIYVDKLNLRAENRNEEAYTISFFNLPDVDHVSDLWNLLEGYVGPWMLPLWFAGFGFLLGRIDRWLVLESGPTSSLAGIFLAAVPMSLEQSISGMLYLGRAFITLLILDRALSLFNFSQGASLGPSPKRSPQGGYAPASR